MHATPDLAEAGRLMTVCNSCRYCEGLCAVFPAMELRRSFADGDLNYLANLCHGCGACYGDCQFSPPHEFQVNVPKVLARVRGDSYAAYAWPGAFRGLFARNGLAMAIAVALAVAGFILGFAAFNDPGALWRAQTGPGAFYALMPHNAMAALFGAAFLYAIVALAMSLRAFWRDIGEDRATLSDPRWLWRAMKDAGSLKYLDGGGLGCADVDQAPGVDQPTDRRRLWHHMAAYGFLLCLASTSTATLYHYLLAREAPYPWWDLPVVLGTVGGVGLVLGSAGLLVAKRQRDPALQDDTRRGMDTAFTAMLFAVGATGLALLLFRATGAMGVLLAIHLGVVFALFLTMPYGKFVHGIYRFAALVRYARERHAMAQGGPL